jgi:RNA polymerase primary sigma factor
MPASRSGFLRVLEKLLKQESCGLASKWLQQIEKEVEARQVLINDLASANLRLVVSIAREYKRKYKHWFITLPDLIQEGSIGLMKACEKFNLAFGCKFSTCASPWIHQACLNFVATQIRQIRLPSHVREDVGIVIRAERQLMNEKGRPGTDEEIAETLGWPIGRIRALKDLPVVSSLNVPIGDNGDEYGDFISDQKEFPIDEIILAEKTQKLLSGLSSREEKVIRGRFAVNSPWRTLESLGQELKVTREWIRQLEKRSIKKLRAQARKQGLDEFLK